MTVVKAGMAQVEELAELNRQLLEDERHPDPMAAAQLAERMASWLQDGYVGYVARRAGAAVGYCLYRDAGRYYCLPAALHCPHPPAPRLGHCAAGLDVRERMGR